LITFRSRFVLTVLFAGSVLVAIPGTAAAGVDQSSDAVSGHAAAASVFLVQGLPDRTVEAQIDGRTVATNLATTKIAGPFNVSAGTHTVTFLDGSGTVVTRNTVRTAAGSSSDLVVHLQTAAWRHPVLTQFPNTTDGVPSSKASVTVAHTAAVAPADIRVDGKVLFANVANGESLNLVVPAGAYRVDIVPTGKQSPVVFGPVTLKVEGGTQTKVYAVGDPAKKTMNVAVHVIDMPAAGSPKPTMIDTGTGGLTAPLQFLAALLRLWRG
jgi:hypothetical protein